MQCVLNRIYMLTAPAKTLQIRAYSWVPEVRTSKISFGDTNPTLSSRSSRISGKQDNTIIWCFIDHEALIRGLPRWLSDW